MAFRALKSFFATADELLQQDLPTLGPILLTHLESYRGLNTVYQHAGLNRTYFRAMLENRSVGLGPLPKEPEYGVRQPEVTKRMMEAWNWLERHGLLIRNDEQATDWFIISAEGEKLLKSGELTLRENADADHSPLKRGSGPFRWEDLDDRLLSPKLQDISDEMQAKSLDGERKAALETRQTRNSASYLPRLFDFQEQLTEEWAQRVYTAHCESWVQENRTVTGDFIRAVRDRTIIPLIAARKSAVLFEISVRATRIRENPNPTSLGEWNRRMDRLAAGWSQRLEAEAAAEEYSAFRPADANDDRRFMILAIEEARKSVAEDGRPHPKVGAVVAKDGKVIAKAHRGEKQKSHAEYVVLEEKLQNETLAGATVYTTLEPCIKRNLPKICCAQRLVDRRVGRVFIGMLDPNPDIRGLGDQLLSEAGIEVQLFPRELRAQVEEMNREFIRDQKEKWNARKSSVASKTVELNSAQPNSPPLDAKPPHVILDFSPRIDDRPRNRKRDLILRNVSSETVVNVLVVPFSVGKTTVICDAVDRLLPNGDTATLTSEMRRAGDVRKPCLVEVDQLFELELSNARSAKLAPTPISITFQDLVGKKYRVSYLARYSEGVNECKLEYKALERVS